MKNTLTNVKSKLLPILAFATVLFLFASPTALATSANQSKVTPQLANVPLTIGTAAKAGPAGTSCSSGGCTFVANYGASSVTVISSKNKVLTTITLPSGSCPIGVAYDASTKLVFVADDCLSQVEIINPKTNTLSSKVVSGIGGAAFIACDDAVSACFVTQFGYGTVTPFNPKTLAVGSAVSQCSYYPEFITLDQKTGLLYVGNNYEGCITVENPKTGATSTITVGDEITGVAAVKSGEVYVDDGYYNEVYLVKGTSVVSTISNSGFDELWGNVANSKGTGVIVDSSASSQAFPISGTKVGTGINVGSYPNAACSNSKITDVTNIDSDSVSVISGTKVITTVNTGDEPFGCAFN